MAEIRNIVIWNLVISVILCTSICRVESSPCGLHGCQTPHVDGGGTPIFTPDSPWYPDGTNVTISCSGILFGQPQHTCIGHCETGYFDTMYFPTCEESSCPQPASPDHGFEIEPVDDYVLYDVISFSCDDGYIMSGAQSVMCTGSGDWHPSFPTCHEDCLVPYVANGYADFAPDTFLHHQDQLNVSCDSSFTLSGVSKVTCRDGIWDPPVGKCFSKCQSPIIPNSDSSVDQGNIDHGEYVIVSCDAGYTFGSGSAYPQPLTCNNGSWNSTLACHIPAHCEQPTPGFGIECSTPPVNGGGTPTFTPASTCYSLGTNVTISCSGVLFGQPEHTCMGGYYDAPSIPTCEEYYCPQPTSPDHGFEIEPVDDYVLYDVVSFSCDDGYILSGAQSVMCTGYGDWHPSFPTCHEDCLVPYVANGYADFAPGTFLHHQDQLNVSCDSSFTLGGVNMVTCRDGLWDPPIGQCFSKCQSPIIPNSDSSVDEGDIDHGEYVVVSCDAGYTFGSGSDYPQPLTCNNGSWNSTLACHIPAHCEQPTPGFGIECSTPPVNGGGTPTFTPASACYSLGTNVTISCSGVLFGQPEHTCMGGYYDAPSIPTCEEYYCPQPTSPDHGFEIEPVDDYVLYDVVSFSCDDGYILSGAQSVMCTGYGDWHPSFPTCHEDCLVPYVANGYADFAPGTFLHHQDQLNVSCDSSFTLGGVNMVTCRDGIWDPPVGQCYSDCQSPIIPNSDSSVDEGDIDHGEYVIVSCDAGCTFGSGSDYPQPLTCNNGSWNSTFKCYANCERPTLPPSLMITPGPRMDNSNYHNDVITVSCAPGYVVSHGPPSGSMSCDDGHWTPTMLPICTHVNIPR